tara:strand:- start:360 stop:959 length:600 start_codon:yes stop_codon:yes gene_type:complete
MIPNKFITIPFTLLSGYLIYRNKNDIIYSIIYSYSWISLKFNRLLPNNKKKDEKMEKKSGENDFKYYLKGSPVEHPLKNNLINYDLCLYNNQVLKPNSSSYNDNPGLSSVKFICFLLTYKNCQYSLDLNDYCVIGNKFDSKFIRYILFKNGVNTSDDNNFEYKIELLDDTSESEMILLDQNFIIHINDNNINYNKIEST